MADNTRIEWADATLNYVNGCTRISPGCGGPGPHGGCYAERLAGTRMRNHPTRAGLTRDTENGPRWTGEIRLNEKALQQAMSWRRPRRIFWNAHGDLFHDNVPDDVILRQFAVCALLPHHAHMILTKRSRRMREWLTAINWRGWCYTNLIETALGDHYDSFSDRQREAFADSFEPVYENGGPLPNVWLGVSVEDQQRADERIPDLLATPAAIRFLSCEPLLGPVALKIEHPSEKVVTDALTGRWDDHATFNPNGHESGLGPKIDWVIAGGESGPRARPIHPDWARALRDQCADAGVPFFFKQWGEWIPKGQRLAGPAKTSLYDRAWCTASEGENRYTRDAAAVHPVGKKAAGRFLDGVEHNSMPGGGR